MAKITLKIDETLMRFAREQAAIYEVPVEDFLRGALEEALARECKEIKRWREAKIFPLTIFMPPQSRDPLADLKEDEGGGVHHSDQDDERPDEFDDDIPF